jgi:hypothetical protein
MTPASQETPLPPEVVSRGRPQQIHTARVASASWLLLLAGLFFLVMAGVCVFVYLRVPFKKDDQVPPETMLYIAAGVALAGLLCCWGAWWKGDFGKGAEEAYLVYPDALVLLQKASCTVVPWKEITAVLSPKNLGDYHITTRDGRTFPIKHAVKDYSNLIATVMTRAAEEIMPALRSALEAGKAVTFGPFEVSRESVGYKGKTLAWDRVAVVRLEVGAMARRLRIRASGSLLPWCYCNLDTVPNGVFFPDLLRLVCPPRLLVQVRRR